MNPTLSRKNRSRCIPTPSGRRTEITTNDIYGIFEPLSRHAQLTTKQIVAFDRRYATKTRNRLTTLFHAEGQWLGRLGQDVKLANYLAHDEIYRIESDAAQLLIAKGVIPNAQWLFNARIGGHSTTPSRIIRLTHDHMASHIVLDIEIGARDDDATRFINHIEIIQAAPEATRALKKSTAHSRSRDRRCDEMDRARRAVRTR